MKPRSLLGLVLITTILATGIAGCGSSRESYTDLISQFICVSCHEPLELVSSPQAQSEKAYLVSLVEKGMTTDEIKSAMVNQYGTAVLGKPPASGFNLTVYILPPLLLIGGLGLLAYTLPKWRARARAAQAAEPPDGTTAHLDPNETARVEDELDRLV